MKSNLKLCTAVMGAAFLAFACGGAEELGDRPGTNAAFSIMGSSGDACEEGEVGFCPCSGDGWSLQECKGGVWSGCLCDDDKAEAAAAVAIQDSSFQNVFGGVFFSEYVEGSSNNKAIEVHNASASAANCTIKMYANGAKTTKTSVSFSIEAGATGAFCNASAKNALKSRCFATDGVANFNGDDALELVCDGVTVDVIGHIGTRPTGGKWTQGEASTLDNTLRRKASIITGRPSTDAAFSSLATEWDVLPKDTFDGIGSHVVEATTDSLTGGGSTTEPSVPVDPVADPGTNTDPDPVNPPVEPDPVVPPVDPEPEPEPEPEPVLPAWTFMVYMNGDNNLYSYAASDFKEMQKLTNSTDINVIVLYDDYGRNNTNLYRVKPGGKELLDSGTEIFSGKEADMGDYKTLKKFGVWATKNYPAQHYALIMWNHGGGWRGEDGASAIFRDFSNDENGNYNGIYISNGNYANALSAISKQAGKKLDIVGFDACLMAMYEVATASAPYADILVGSEETEPANGWSYDYFLPLLSKNPSMAPVDFAKNIVDGYYKSGNDNATLSVTDLSTMGDLQTKLDAFADAVKAANAKSTFKSIRDGLFQLAVEEHVDLGQFAQKVAASSSVSSTVKLAANELDAQIKTTVVYEKAHNYFDSYYRQYFYYDNYTNGMAIYFPVKKNSTEWSAYQQGVWYSKTSWGSMVSSLW